jgi:hypothetical protein
MHLEMLKTEEVAEIVCFSLRKHGSKDTNW